MKPKDRVRLLQDVEYPHLGFVRMTARRGQFAIVDRIETGPGALLTFYNEQTRATTYGWVNRSKFEVVA